MYTTGNSHPVGILEKSNDCDRYVIPQHDFARSLLLLTYYTDRFIAILPHLFAVYREADGNAKVLSSDRLPTNFHEESALLIVSSYHNHLASGDTEFTTINDRYDSGGYDTAYQLYHDIKVVCSALISSNKPGSAEYTEIDFFYKFSTELLLRELARVNVKFQEEPKQDKVLELESLLVNDYNKISHTYQLNNGEVITHIFKAPESSLPTPMAQNIYANHAHMPPPPRLMQPLFSSLLGRSHLDINPTIVPENFNVARVVPFNKNIARNDATIDTLSPAITKFPGPGDNSSCEILQDFFHPIWYTIPVPTWLSYKDLNKQKKKESDEDSGDPLTLSNEEYLSFAPTRDLRKSIISSTTKLRIWLDHIGAKHVKNIKDAFLKKQGDADPDHMDVDSEQETKSDLAAELEQANQEKSDASKTEVTGKLERTNSRKINIANIALWDPESHKVLDSLQQDRDEIFRSAKSLQAVISRTLLRLNKERQERFKESDTKGPVPPLATEHRLYSKAQKLLVLLVDLYNVAPGQMPARVSTTMPVLTTEYAGVLPGVPANKLGSAIVAATPTNKSVRLPSIRGPYKKRNKNA